MHFTLLSPNVKGTNMNTEAIKAAEYLIDQAVMGALVSTSINSDGHEIHDIVRKVDRDVTRKLSIDAHTYTIPHTDLIQQSVARLLEVGRIIVHPKPRFSLSTYYIINPNSHANPSAPAASKTVEVDAQEFAVMKEQIALMQMQIKALNRLCGLS